MNSEKYRKLSELILCSRDMLESAKAGEWEKVIEMEIRHRYLLKEFFSMPLSIEDTKSVSNAIYEMLSINENLQNMIARSRTEVKDEADSMCNGRRAISAYAENVR